MHYVWTFAFVALNMQLSDLRFKKILANLLINQKFQRLCNFSRNVTAVWEEVYLSLEIKSLISEIDNYQSVSDISSAFMRWVLKNWGVLNISEKIWMLLYGIHMKIWNGTCLCMSNRSVILEISIKISIVLLGMCHTFEIFIAST